MQLGWYLNDVKMLLNDLNSSFYPESQLIRWINEARSLCAKRSSCIRRLITGQSAFGASSQPGSIIPGAVQPGSLPDASPGAINSMATNSFATIPGSERYPFVGFANEYLKAQHEGIKGICDVILVSVSWGNGGYGSPKPVLDWRAFEDFQAYARANSVLVKNYPVLWTVYNDGEQGEVWMFPVPVAQSEMDWDVFCTPADLVNDGDFDAIPDSFSDAIKFGAASLAYMMSGKYGQSQLMENQFAERLGVARVSVDHGKTTSFYF